MDKKTQLFLRIIIPTFIGLIFFLLVSSSSLHEAMERIASHNIELTKFTLPAILMLILGFVTHYYIRPKIYNNLWGEIDFEVKQRLVKIAQLNDVDAYKLLSTKKRLLRIFFKVIDSDESLKQTSDKVRVNGLIITSLADIQFFSGISFVFIFAKSFFSSNILYWDISIATLCSILFFFSDHLINLHKKKHIEMGSDQLLELRTHHQDLVNEKIRELLNDVNSHG